MPLQCLAYYRACATRYANDLSHVACCLLRLATCCWQSQAGERFVADGNCFLMAKRSQQKTKRKGRGDRGVRQACTHTWHISRLSNFIVEMAPNAVTAHRSWQQLRIAWELQSTWRQIYLFHLRGTEGRKERNRRNGRQSLCVLTLPISVALCNSSRVGR